MTKKKLIEWVNTELEKEYPYKGYSVKEIYHTRYRPEDYHNGAYRMHISVYTSNEEFLLLIFSDCTLKELSYEIKRTNGRLAIDWGKTRWKNQDPLLEVIK